MSRLATAPGVGAVTAVSFVATLDRAHRFASAKQARAYLGLVPREYSSGERQQRGSISKVGPSRARSLLVSSAWTILRHRTSATAALHDWAMRIAGRRGRKIAAVALARKAGRHPVCDVARWHWLRTEATTNDASGIQS
jgi:transposase